MINKDFLILIRLIKIHQCNFLITERNHQNIAYYLLTYFLALNKNQ